MQSEPKCPKCGSARVVKNGWRRGRTIQRWICQECGFRTTNPHLASPTPKFNTKIPPNKIYVVTAAQNATPVHAAFWRALQQYCKHRDATLVCVPIRYRNPTSPQETKRADQDDGWWDENVVPYLVKARARLHKSLVLLADVHINPTAARPLSGLDAITGGASGIVPHTKAEMRTVATPHHSLPKIMITTGAVTGANYSDSKAGAKGKFHHILGALVVEIDKDVFHLRRINAGRDGSFVDLATEYGGKRVKRAQAASALVLGDIHVGFEDEGVRKATFEGKGGLVQLLRPRHIVWHDVLDFRSHNHWDEKKPFVQLAKAKAGKTSVLEELKAACDFISVADGSCGWKPLHIFPFSNHPDAFMRWMERTDWRDDLENAELYLETALEMARWAEWGEHGAEIVDPFVFWAKKHMRATLLARCVFLGPNDSFMLEGVEVGMHGHLGPNGARGSLANLSTLGVKSITGHVHSPGERDGAISVGTSSRLFMGYNLGPSSWLNSHCCLQKGGKRQMINVIKGRAYLA